MRRILESDALKRDDSDPFLPSERRDSRPTAHLSGNGRYRTINWQAFSHAFMPMRMRDKAVSVGVRTTYDEYRVGEKVEVQILMVNTWPFPITLKTRSSVGWTWAVDGVEEASHLESELDDREGLLQFQRGERKRFYRDWYQSFKVSEREWEPVSPGEYTISVAVDVPNARKRGLCEETTVKIK